MNVERADRKRSKEDIAAWLAADISDLLGVPPQSVSTDTPFSHLGLDSVAAVALTGDLEVWLRRLIEPTLLYDYPTIDELSRHLADNA